MTLSKITVLFVVTLDNVTLDKDLGLELARRAVVHEAEEQIFKKHWTQIQIECDEYPALNDVRI